MVSSGGGYHTTFDVSASQLYSHESGVVKQNSRFRAR